ncbi:DUF488 family protein [Candidatus Poribacteria bacterium]
MLPYTAAMILYTIGYQGLQPDEFIQTLRQHGVDIIIDVREIPHSRKRGFSLKHLTVLATANYMEYFSFRTLGSPTPLRQKLRQDGNHQEFLEEYRKYLAGQKEDLDKVISMAQRGTCCLLCYEKDADFCHRKIVASEIAELDQGMQIVHL